MPARLPSNYVRWVDTVGCHACQAIFEQAGLNDGDFFVCPKCGGVERFVAGYMWPKGSSLGIAWFDEKGNPLPPNPEEEKLRAKLNEMIASMMPPEASRELPDPFSPPPVLAPLGHETNPEAGSVLRGLTIAGTVAAFFVLALALLAVNGAFERRRPPDPPVYQPTPEELAARAAETAAEEARQRDVDSIVANWPEELSGYRTAGRYFHAILATDEWEEANGLVLGDGRYRTERNDEGELRLVRIEEEEESGEPSSEATVSSAGEAPAEAPSQDEAAEPQPSAETP